MIILGLTGSMGMGKSTTSSFFLKAGVPVYNSDSVVEGLYSEELVPLIEKIFPGTIEKGVVSKEKLSALLIGDSKNLKFLESLVHPILEEKRREFIKIHYQKNTPLIVIESPLLFEVGLDIHVDKILVVTASKKIQKERVFLRKGMTKEKFTMLLSNQMSDKQKRKHADYVLNTSCSLEDLEKKVKNIIKKLLKTKEGRV